MSFITDCSNEALLNFQSYLIKKGIIIKSIEPFIGIDNKTYGDLKVDGFTADDNSIQLNIDFKRQEKDRPYIPIELIYVKADGTYDGWLYNNNEDYIVYEFKNGATYIFSHTDLIRLAKYYNRQDVWNTCLVYSRNPDKYLEERIWINDQLKMYDVEPFPLRGKISCEDIHINGAFNYTSYGKVHSGFCLNIPLRYANYFASNNQIFCTN